LAYGLDQGRMANPGSTIIIHYAALNPYFGEPGLLGRRVIAPLLCLRDCASCESCGRGRVAKPFYEKPILNSPYYLPTRHHALDDKGQPLEHEPILGRRRSRYLTPVPSARRRRAAAEMELPFHTQEGQPGTYNENAIVNEIRRHVGDWRAVPNPNDWGVTPATQRPRTTTI
jgi:hypothetical protein